MAGADRDARQVEDLRDVVGMDPLHVERDDPRAPVGGRAVERHARDLGELAERVLRELVLVLRDLVQADRLEVVDRRAEADRLGDRRRARLELVRQLAPRRLVRADE